MSDDQGGGWDRVSRVAKWFGVDAAAASTHDGAGGDGLPPDLAALRAGQVILITGPSGSGKSTLLRRLRAANEPAGVRWLDLARVRLTPARAAVVDVMAAAMGGGRDDPAVVAALESLSRVGLGEVWTYLRAPAELSEGQRWRLRLAVAMAQPARRRSTSLTVLAADEFGAVLDRVTAAVVARALRRSIAGRADACAVVATSHADLERALAPDVVVRCDFGAVRVDRPARGRPV